MATLTVVQAVQTGAALALASAAGGGDEFVNTGKEALIVNNGSGAPVDVTLTTPQTVNGLAVADRAVTVAAGAQSVIGPFPKGLYNDANGKVQIAYSSATSVTVGVLRI